jgi:hypothetical protein
LHCELSSKKDRDCEWSKTSNKPIDKKRNFSL